MLLRAAMRSNPLQCVNQHHLRLSARFTILAGGTDGGREHRLGHLSRHSPSGHPLVTHSRTRSGSKWTCRLRVARSTVRCRSLEPSTFRVSRMWRWLRPRDTSGHDGPRDEEGEPP